MPPALGSDGPYISGAGGTLGIAEQYVLEEHYGLVHGISGTDGEAFLVHGITKEQVQFPGALEH